MKKQCYKELHLLTKVTCNFLTIVVAVAPAHLGAAQSQLTALSPGLNRLSGIDQSSRIEYVRLFLDGILLPPSGGAFATLTVRSDSEPSSAAPLAVSSSPSGSAAASPSTIVPTLVAQCTRKPSGKLAFELLSNFGGVSDLTYYPPWTPANSSDLFPPRLEKPAITMEFLGYTHVKPVKRQWEALLQPVGQYRYNPPSAGSSNMEDSTYYLRFLVALPTLRLTLVGKAVEFNTTALLDQIRKEPLCKASLLEPGTPIR
jgi:hypothetical protein